MSDYRGSTTPEATRDMTQTPLWLFRALDLEFNFALDAAALPETALCEKFLTPDIDALSVDWATLSARQCARRGHGSTHPTPISGRG